jgi:hypothetical protein
MAPLNIQNISRKPEKDAWSLDFAIIDIAKTFTNVIDDSDGSWYCSHDFNFKSQKFLLAAYKKFQFF